jgi:hypothetical protein
MNKQNYAELLKQAEEKRIAAFMEKRAQQKLSFKWGTEDEGNVKKIKIDFGDDISPYIYETIASAYHAATGSTNENFAANLFVDTFKASTHSSNPDITPEAIFGGLMGMSPQDEIEGMLCAQLITAYHQSMRYLDVANKTDKPAEIDQNLHRVVKLVRIQNEMRDSLVRYRKRNETPIVIKR